jgi:hypothetical protein
MPYMKIFEREAKSSLDSELYNNIFVKTELSDEEIYATSNQIWNSTTVNRDLIMDIFSCMNMTPDSYGEQIRLINFAKALYICDISKHISIPIDNYILVKLPMAHNVRRKPSVHDDVIAIIDKNKIIGAFYSDMRVRKVLRCGQNTAKLPVIKDKVLIDKITSVVTLLKLKNDL